MDILCIFWHSEGAKNHENHRFSPSRKKLNISKNPWHHLSALGPSIVGVIPPSRSQDIPIFTSTWKSDILKFLSWLILHVRPLSGKHRNRPSAALCPCRVPRNPWKVLRPSELPADTSHSFPATRGASRDLPQSRHLPTTLDSQGFAPWTA